LNEHGGYFEILLNALSFVIVEFPGDVIDGCKSSNQALLTISVDTNFKSRIVIQTKILGELSQDFLKINVSCTVGNLGGIGRLGDIYGFDVIASKNLNITQARYIRIIKQPEPTTKTRNVTGRDVARTYSCQDQMDIAVANSVPVDDFEIDFDFAYIHEQNVGFFHFTISRKDAGDFDIRNYYFAIFDECKRVDYLDERGNELIKMEKNVFLSRINTERNNKKVEKFTIAIFKRLEFFRESNNLKFVFVDKSYDHHQKYEILLGRKEGAN